MDIDTERPIRPGMHPYVITRLSWGESVIQWAYDSTDARIWADHNLGLPYSDTRATIL